MNARPFVGESERDDSRDHCGWPIPERHEGTRRVHPRQGAEVRALQRRRLQDLCGEAGQPGLRGLGFESIDARTYADWG
jgi:hypothetical protein